MPSQLTENGVSTTRTPGQFAYEAYVSVAFRGLRVQWDYRDTRGKLHSGIARSIEDARQNASAASGETVAF